VRINFILSEDIRLLNRCSGVSSLPGEIKRNFTLIEELDTRTKETLEQIDGLSREKIDEEHQESAREDIRNWYATCIEFANEKIGLASQTYELVDKHIRRLDVDLRKFEQELEKAQPGNSKFYFPPIARFFTDYP
jgi:chromosome segregation ATPase